MVTAPLVGGKGMAVGKSPDQTLPHPPGDSSPPRALNTPPFHHRGEGAGAAAEKGTGCIR